MTLQCLTQCRCPPREIEKVTSPRHLRDAQGVTHCVTLEDNINWHTSHRSPSSRPEEGTYQLKKSEAEPTDEAEKMMKLMQMMKMVKEAGII